MFVFLQLQTLENEVVDVRLDHVVLVLLVQVHVLPGLLQRQGEHVLDLVAGSHQEVQDVFLSTSEQNAGSLVLGQGLIGIVSF